MNVKDLVARKFKLNPTYTGWQQRNCPYHGDENASAAISLRFKRFTCLGCGEKKTLDQLWEDVRDKKLEFKQKVRGVRYRSNTHHKVGDQVEEMVKFLKRKRLSMKTIKDCGGKYDGNPASPYYGYLTFKLFDGTITARRILSLEKPRFLNSKKKKGLLGVECISKYDVIILCEGLTDYLSLWELGYRNIVCSLGAKLTKEQAYLLRHKQVVIIYDRDFAGYTGALQAQELLSSYNSNAVILELPYMFGDSATKIDISDAYLKDRDGLDFFIKEGIGKYESNDVNYIRNIKKRKELKYFSTGIPKLDVVLNGGFTQGAYGITGKTKVGKSTLLATFARSFVKQRQKVAWFTYELPIDQVWARYASTYSQYEWVALERTTDIWEDSVIVQLEADANYLKICSDPTTEDILARCRHYQIIIFDYLQVMPSKEKDPNNAVRLNNKLISTLIGQGKTVIFVSSMNRDSYDKDDSPGFKGSGDIEYTMQGGMKLIRLGENKVGLRFLGNTRGKTKNLILTLDIGHQTVRKADYELEENDE